MADPSKAQPIQARDKLAFHERVHILIGGIDDQRGVGANGLAHLLETDDQRLRLGLRQHTCAREPTGPGHAARDVVFNQATIHRQRAAMPEYLSIGRNIETT